MECNCVRKITEGLLRKYSTLWQHRCEKSNNSVKKSIHLGRRPPKFWGPRLEPIGKSGTDLRDRPFNLQGWGGGYGYLFPSEFFFSDNTRVRIFLFLSRKARIFFPEFNIRLYDKNSESDFFFPSPKSEYFFQQHWESEYFFRKKTITPLSS